MTRLLTDLVDDELVSRFSTRRRVGCWPFARRTGNNGADKRRRRRRRAS
jgi:hypothetical protein